jgi:ethanolamine utilization cobalamin adenosyltransferase
MEVRMKFITEEDLRDLYRKEPFTEYELEPGARFTPGARQFLMDKGINMFDTDSRSKGKIAEAKPEAPSEVKKSTGWNKRLYHRMKAVEALFFLTEEELLRRDVCLAQNVIKLGKQFSGIKNSLKNNTPVENLCCSACTGINQTNFCEDLEDCFEITEFHIQLEKGREMLLLHRLRCELNELKLILPELCEKNGDEKETCEDMTGKLNQIVNSLSQLICIAFGGKKCQRLN